MDETKDLPELDGIDLFDLTVTDVGEEAAAFAVAVEGNGGSCCCCCDVPR